MDKPFTLLANGLMQFLSEWHPIAAYPIHVAAMIAIDAPAALVPARRAIGGEPSVLLREE